jgi:hypothetical protein
MPDTPVAGDRASIVAELRAVERGAPEPTPAEPAAPAPAADPVSEEVEADLDAEPEVAVELEPEAAPPPAPAADPDTTKRLAQVQRAERAAREQLQAAKREFEDERERWRSDTKERLSKVERFEALASRAKYDLAAVAAELGIPEADFEYHAEQLYRRSPKAKADPRHREAAERSAREREQADRIAKLEKQIEERAEQEKQASARAAQERAAQDFLERTEKAVGDETPIVKSMLAKNPKGARARLARVAIDLLRENPEEIPDSAAVVKALEAERRAELAELGIDFPSARGIDGASGTVPVKVKEPGAGEKTRPSARAVAASESRPVHKSPEEQRQEIVQALKEGRIE